MKIYITCAFSFMIALSVFGQYEEEPDKLVMPEIGVSFGLPKSVYADNQYQVGYGLEAGIHFQFDPSHSYLFGIQSSYFFLGANSVLFEEQSQGDQIEIKESVTSHQINILGVARYYPDFNLGKGKIYGELLFGPKIFFTSISIRDTDGGEYINDFEVEDSDVSLSYGAGLGLQYPLWSFTYLQIKANYLPGVSAGFYTKKNEYGASDYAIDAFDYKNSATNTLNLTIGVSFFL